MKNTCIKVLCAASIFAAPLMAHATLIGNTQGGADFPAGAVSFADAVIDYTPGIVSGNPATPYRGADNATGLPDYQNTNGCASQADCTFVTLGDGGSITLKFVDNLLTGSGTNAADLWIFEVGPDVEDTYVEISMDGVTFYSVGKVFGTTAGVDIDAFGWGINDQFAYVRLTDDTNEGQQSGTTVGADIDAVGAISTVAVSVPEPGTLALLGLAIGGLGAFQRRKHAR